MNRFEEILTKLEDIYNDSILENNETNTKHALIAAECEGAFRELAGMYGTAKRELASARKRIGALNSVNHRETAYWMKDEDGCVVCSRCGGEAILKCGDEYRQTDYCPDCGAIMRKRTKEELDLEECQHCGGLARFEIHTAEDRYEIFTTPTVLVVCEECGCRTKGTEYDRDAEAGEKDSIEAAMETEKKRWNGER